MIHVLRTQVSLPGKSTLPADNVMNVWHFTWDDAGPTGTLAAAMDKVRDRLRTFYAVIDGKMPSQLLNTAATITFFDLSDPVPRQPKRVDTLTLVVSGATGLPPEVALCLSYQGARQSGFPQSRRRGRLFLGPWTVDMIGSSARPNATDVVQITTAAEVLRAAGAAGDVSWVVWSPTDIAFAHVTDGWIDDEWDTHRSRGRRATGRTVFP